MSNKWTPGPWEIDPESGELKGNGYILGMIYGSDYYPCLDDEDADEFDQQLAECYANGQLAKAAPDLYKALAFAKSCLLSGEPWTEACDELIDGALKKARGEE